MQKIDAVIFDMDGLLLDTEAVNFRAWTTACSEFGYKFERGCFSLLMGTNRENAGRILTEFFGEKFPREEILSRQNALRAEIFAREGITPKPGAYDILDFLDKQGVKKALATSTAKERAEGCLSSVNLSNRFDAKIYGDMVSESKPNPRIFLLAAASLGVNPRNCTVLEDSPNGVKAAAAAEMTPIMVPDMAEPDGEIKALYYACVPNLVEAIGVLSKSI